MPEDVEETKESILDDNPDMDESTAYAIAYDQHGDDEDDDSEKAKILREAFETASPEDQVTLAKSVSAGTVERVSFEASVEGSIGALYKQDDEFTIWGPASVEVVDKENDRIQADALEEALPQLLKRERLTWEHTDQIVGEILKEYRVEDPVEVEFNGHTTERDSFPTDVLKLDGMEHPGLFVAGKLYEDTKKAQEVREMVEEGEVDSYSISGEAIVSSMAIEDGDPVNEISKIDLSAVTLARRGMNQRAKFDTVVKSDGSVAIRKSETPETASLSPNEATQIIERETSTMGDNDPLTKSGMEDILDKHLPDGELATKEDVEQIAESKARSVFKENATETEDETEGQTERPSGDDENPVEQDNDYEGDNADETASDPDKMEEKAFHKHLLDKLGPEGYRRVVKEMDGDDGLGLDEPEPEPDEEEEEDEPITEPSDDEPALEEVSPDDGPEMKAKALGLDPDGLTEEQKAAIAKADGLEKTASTSFGEAAGTPFYEDDDETLEKALESAEGTTTAGGNFFDSEGGVDL
jgi:hypothetical protein